MKLDSARVLVTGGSGTVGWALSEALAPTCRVISTYDTHPHVPGGTEGIRLDLCDPGSIEEVVQRHGPDVIFHLAALTHPDECERDPGRAMRVNVEATRELAGLAEASGSRLIFVSTDLVFDGSKGNYSEDDEPRPLSVYGRSKLRAEEAVLDTCKSGAVIRSSLVIGRGSRTSKTFLTRMIETLAGGGRMKLFTDQKRNPILAGDLAKALIIAAEQDLEGLYHVAGPQTITRYDFGLAVCETFGYDKDLLVAIRMQDFDYVAERPLDSSLNTAKFTGATGFTPRTISEALEWMGEQGARG